MANAKSNIYPIQLQGAELCLNRYDAEIKQYSGFNKNNSPFVGGCLSNVFTKEEQIEGGNDDNVYIDENGDIYRVDTTGLYKNDTKIIDYTDRDFIDIEKIEVPYTDVIKAYSDKVFLRNVDGQLYLNDILVGTMPNMPLADFLATYSCGVWYHGKFIFACLTYYGPTSNLRRFITMEKNAEGEYVLGKVNYSWDMEEVFYGYNPGSSPISIIINNDYFVILLATYNYSEGRQTTFRKYLLYSGNFNSSVITENTSHFSDLIATAPDWDNYYYIDSYSKGGEFTSFEILSYPRNEIVFRNINRGSDLHRYVISAKLNAEECQEQFIIHKENVLSHTGEVIITPSASYEYQTGYYGSANLLPSSIVNYPVSVIKVASSPETTIDNYYFILGPRINGFRIQNRTFSNSGAILKVRNIGNSRRFDVVAGATREMDNCIFAVLINNGSVSGIAAKNGIHKILVTDWNTVDETLITYYQDDESDTVNLLYGDYNGNYYLLKKTETPKLKRVYNQIVTNVLYNYNSWMIKENKALCYATGFNMSPSYNVKRVPFSDLQETNLGSHYKFIAAAINEYKLEDNASIILNPTGCHITQDYEILSFLGIDCYSTSEGVTEGAIPIYVETQTLINSTVFRKEEKDMVALPFPVDANGNVTYSPNLFSEIKSLYGNDAFIKNGNTFYPLIVGNNTLPVMSFYLASGIDNFEDGFIIQGQFYGIINNGIYSVAYNNGVVSGITFIVSVENLQFVGNTPYEALFFSKTNRCLYSFTGANVLNQKQLVDKISEVRDYLYNPATQTVFLITDIGVLFYGLFGMFLLDYTNITNIFLLDNGIVMSDNNGNYRYIKYYLDEGDTDFEKQNIRLETSFYGMNNEMVTINDCLYFRIFSEEHEEGDLKVSATTISLSGRKTEETTFKIKASDWDKITHTIYLRYQPKTQRGLGVAFAIDSPFKIASMSVGSQPDAVLVDKVSKGAITAPSVTSNNNEW